MSNGTQSQHAEQLYARTNRELFRPRESTGNPHYDFYTHYSRLSGLQRLSLETHTVNGTQISRYEPDISHSTTCAGAPGFVDSAPRACARAFVRRLLSLVSHQKHAYFCDGQLCARSVLSLRRRQGRRGCHAALN